MPFGWRRITGTWVRKSGRLSIRCYAWSPGVRVLLHTRTVPEFDLLRADPRFQVLLRRLDVPK
jgi:hypothetical protein